MISAVFDCVVYVQAVLSNQGPAFACLTLAQEEHVDLHVSEEILAELKASLESSTLRKKNLHVTDERVEEFLERLRNASTISQNPPAVFSLRRDPKDEPYLNLAIEMRAGFLVRWDKDLLDLMKDDTFRKAYPTLTILNPVDFLKHVRTEIAKQLGYE